MNLLVKVLFKRNPLRYQTYFSCLIGSNKSIGNSTILPFQLQFRIRENGVSTERGCVWKYFLSKQQQTQNSLDFIFHKSPETRTVTADRAYVFHESLIFRTLYQTKIKALKTSMSNQILNTQRNRIVTQFKVQILSLEMVSAKTSILAPNLTKTQI